MAVLVLKQILQCMRNSPLVSNTIAFPNEIHCQTNKTLCRKICTKTPSSRALIKAPTALSKHV